jgi:CRP/FNR family transcriptional regulator
MVPTVDRPIQPIRIVPVMNTARGAVSAPAAGCSACASRHLCLPHGMSEAEAAALNQIAIGRRRVRLGDTLYRQGEGFQFIFAVRSGTFKSSITLADGREQVSGFHMAGELMGLDGVASGAHASTAVALEDAEICSIPYAPMSDVPTSAAMQRAVTRQMSREIVREHSLMMLLGSMSADERVAAFLLNMSQRMKARGYSPHEFHLRMSRAEIGSYLGMKLETVSRTLSAFQQQGLLEVDKRHIRITSPDTLESAFGSRIQ